MLGSGTKWEFTEKTGKYIEGSKCKKDAFFSLKQETNTSHLFLQ